MPKIPYYSSCVDWPPPKLDALHTLCDNGREIKLATFKRHADLSNVGNLFGAKLDDVLKDRCTRFYAYRGVYWFEWSAIEFVYATPEQIAKM